MNLPFFHRHQPLLNNQHIHVLPSLLKQHYPEQGACFSEALDMLYLAWLFREFHTPADHASKNLLWCFQQPAWRQQQAGNCPAGLIDYLHLYDKLADDKLYWQEVPLSSAQQQAMQFLQQQFPLLSLPLSHTDWQRQMALLCTGVILDYCQQQQMTNHSALLNNGIETAFIALQQANHYGGHGLRAWLGSMMHCLALLLIHRQLQNSPARQQEHVLLADIAHIHHRLAYWISKDWGLPDDLLFSLKQRFLPGQSLPLNAIVMQRAEHSQLILDSCRQQCFGKRQALHMLQLLHQDDRAEQLANLL